MRKYFIHCTINNSTILLMPVKIISWYGIFPEVLSRYAFNILRNKFSQDLALIWWIPRAMYETDFLLILQVVYICFFALSCAFTHHGVSMWWGKFSSIFPNVTSTGGIYPSRLPIRRLYETFMYIFHNHYLF